MEITAQPITTTSSLHGEGALWDEQIQRLLWVDIDGCKVNLFNPATGENPSVATGSPIGTVVPTRSPSKVAAALKDGFATVDLKSGAVEYLVRMDLGGPRFNDGKADPAGRFWAGTMARGGAAILYRLDADRSLHTMLTGVSISNGIVWSRDHKTMYYIDTATGMVEAFDYDNATGAITNRRCTVKVPSELGHPDGMAIDSLDRLWVAMWGGARVCCFDPKSAQLLHTVHTPKAKHSSACSLGGPNLDTLFITTSCQGIKPEESAPGGTQENSGRLFFARIPATGLPVFRYAG
jgi:sugar lactone lactonase YvrE